MHAEINPNRRFGIELEIYAPVLANSCLSDVQRNLADILTANGINAVARNYSHEPLNNADVAIETDGSIGGTSNFKSIAFASIEVKTRIITLADYKQIMPKVLEILKFLGFRINSTCGFHIHYASEEVKTQGYKFIRSLLNCCYKYENCFLNIISESRRQNHFCKGLPSNYQNIWNRTSGRRFQSMIRSHFDRYYGLNLTHIYEPDPHIEIRFHQGTLDYEKITNWLFLWNRVIQAATEKRAKCPKEKLPGTINDLENLFIAVGLKCNSRLYTSISPELSLCRKYWIKRFRHFQNPDSQQAEPAAQFVEEVA